MKKVLLLLLFLFVAVSIYPTVLLTEDFEYEAGTELEGQGTPNAWTLSTNSNNQMTVSSPLTISSASITLPCYGDGDKANGLGLVIPSASISPDNSKQRVSYKTFDTNKSYNSGCIYAAFLINVSEATNSTRDFLAFEGSTGTAQRGRLFVKKNDTGFQLGVTRANTSPVMTETLEVGRTYLAVLKYKFVEGSNNDVATIYINFPLGYEEDASSVQAKKAQSTDTEESSSDPTSLKAISIKQREGVSTIQIAHLRVATTWEEAVNYTLPYIDALDLQANFSDGTWGEMATSDYASGSYPNVTLNGYVLSSAGMRKRNATCAETEECFTGSVVLDKVGNGAMLTLPTVANMSTVTVYASAGSEGNALKLQRYNFETTSWEDVETYNYETTDCIKKQTTIDSDEPVKLRLANADGSKKFIYKIVTASNATKDRLNYIFGDDIWSDLGTSSTTTTVNEVNFVKCARNTTAEGKFYYATTGEKFTGRVVMDKNNGTSEGIIEMPAVISAARADIYAAAGSDDKELKVQKYNYISRTWEDAETIHLSKSGVYYRSIIPLNSQQITKLRLINPDNSAKQILKVITYATAPEESGAPIAKEATNISAHSFTAHWETVSGAEGYRVILYLDKALKKVQEVTSSTTMYSFNNLDANTEYTYTIVAVRNGATTVDEISNEISVTTAAEITDTYTRAVTNGNYGTICLPKACEDVSGAGAVFYEVAGKVLDGVGALQEIVFDEVTELVAGKPYIFRATADALNIPLTGDAVESVVTSGTKGLKGSFTVKAITGDANKYILSNNKLYCTAGQTYYVGENRAYFDITNMPEYEENAPAPGRRRVSLQVEAEQTATGEQAAVSGQQAAGSTHKAILNGQLIIIRNGIHYDVTGRRME